VEAKELEWILKQGFSVNLYMFHGGTSFGWMSGANIDGRKYDPDVTSYDYDVPVSESGELRQKFFLFRDVIRTATGVTPPDPPAPIAAQALPAVLLKQSASIWDTLPQPIESAQILSMEDVGQSYGYILYRTNLEHAMSGELRLDEVHDYAQVYVDGVLAGTLDRRLGQSSLQIHLASDNARLDILVEDTGRVNFGRQFPQERAGITHSVTLDGVVLTGWQIYPLPMDRLDSLAFKSGPCTGPCFYEATLQIDTPVDTFVDTRSMGKGEVFINGRALGRFWQVGPQRTLYLPAPWLKRGANQIVVFDLDGKPNATVPLLGRAILDENGK
jgi:beta-galactosidase